jgi:hypothetical protein
MIVSANCCRAASPKIAPLRTMHCAATSGFPLATQSMTVEQSLL